MEYILSLSALVNAAGAFLFLAVGLAILFIARTSRRGLLIGLLSAAFGWTFVVDNLLDYAFRSTAEAWIVGASMGMTALVAFLLCVDLLGQVGSRERRVFWSMTAASIAVSVAAVLALVLDPALDAFAGTTRGFAGTFVYATRVGLLAALALLIVSGALAFRALPSDDQIGRRAVAALTVAFGLFTMFWVEGSAIAPVGFASPAAIVTFASIFLLGLVAIAGATMFVIPPLPVPSLGRGVFAALTFAGFLAAPALLATGVDFAAASAGFGIFGILRTIGAVFLVRAVLRYGLLGVPLPTFAVRRGTIATGALAVLFIVAQIAQNVLSSAYGLITGGLVAGAFLFAAQPLQRAMENLISNRGARTPRPVTSGAATENERVYRLALEKFGADGRVTADEELALAHLADVMGITTRRATELRLDLARKKGAG